MQYIINATYRHVLGFCVPIPQTLLLYKVHNNQELKTPTVNMDEYIKNIIDKQVKKLDIVVKFNEFKESLQKNKIDERSNFVEDLIGLVKEELEKNNEEQSVIVQVDGGDIIPVNEGDVMEIKDFIGFLSDEERKIFRSIIFGKNKKDYSRRDEENEYNAIKLLIDYFISKWNKKVENLKFMFLVSNLLPYLIEKSYKIPIDDLIPKLDYVEFPEIEFKTRKFSPTDDSTHKLSSTILTHNKFPSTRENLWGYEFPTFNYKHSFFDRLYKFTTPLNILLYRIHAD
jgi:hypothetical protein